jgi:hypothetical protein
MQPTVIWKIIYALSGIYAIRESDSNASKTVLEKLMGASQSRTGGGKRRRRTNLLTL